MNDEAIPAANDVDQGVGAFTPVLMHIALLVQIVIHSVTAMYAHPTARRI